MCFKQTRGKQPNIDMALPYYHAVRIAFIALIVMQVVHIADAQTGKWTDTCYNDPCKGGSGKNYDCPNVPDFMSDHVCETLDQVNLWSLNGKNDTSDPFAFLTWSDYDTRAGIDWNDCSNTAALQDVETLFVIIHGAGEDPDRFLASMWDAIAQENGGLQPYEGGGGKASSYVIAPYFQTKKETGVPNSLSWQQSSDWVDGRSPIELPGVSSYEIMDNMLSRIAVDKDACMPNLTRLVLVGFSAGGQFAQRYALVSPVFSNLDNSLAEVFIGSPMSVAYFNMYRPDLSRNYGPNNCWSKTGPDPDSCRAGLAANCKYDTWLTCLTQPTTPSSGNVYDFGEYSDSSSSNFWFRLPQDATVGWDPNGSNKCTRESNGEQIEWNVWPFQWEPSKNAPNLDPGKYLATYRSDRTGYTDRYTSRTIRWYVGCRDGMDTAGMGRAAQRCPLEIQGDSHVQTVLAAYDYVQFETKKNKKVNNHELYMLDSVRHSVRDAINHNSIRSCLVSNNCDTSQKVHSTCGYSSDRSDD